MKLGLTEEQIQQACHAYATSLGDHVARMKAAAPYLQIPWAEPTAKECDDASRYCGHSDYRSVVCQFVFDRNAALLSKPEDHLIMEVAKVIQSDEFNRLKDRAHYKQAAEMVLAALGKEGK